MESRPEVRLSGRMYQLAEQHHVGSPLGLYSMHPWWLRFVRVLRNILLFAVICAVLFAIVVFSIFFYQLVERQIVDVEWRLMISLPSTVIGLLGCVFCLFARYIIAQSFPLSYLVCTEGLLAISPKKVYVTPWDEVRGILPYPSLWLRKRYMLSRVNRSPLFLDETFEDVEGLVSLVRQQISKNEG